jgi:nucleoside-diphosphate-sugar epimerase
MQQRRILIVGATGLVGTAATEHFAALPDWEVVTLSRRRPPDWFGSHLGVDLSDPGACAAALRNAPPITHVLYAALHEEDDLEAGWRSDQQQQTNLAMLRNVLDGVEARGALERVTILQGGKAYGSHLGRVPVPAKERWPRMPHRIFYWQQEDLLRERAARGGFSFNILRPQLILGRAASSPMNIISAIGVYAAVLRELGHPLHFPGGGTYVTACTDSRLIAQAVEFCATNESVRGETFNVVNGDAIVWRDMWPSLAAHFAMPAGEDVPTQLSEVMPRRADVWDAVVAKHRLQPRTMAEVVGSSWQTADLTFGFGKDRPFDRLMSPIKLRQAGFPGCMDTEDAVRHWLRRLQAENIIPSY